ncbi:GNAT family N-acetyltransferase [Paenibacillus paeoniae]|uniref:GNAT family N-acetyltransferase n=1 Tax=Paenibacillus paeoniae TaxID=2292705 RepID=A0A371PKG3_9BACL|nr:GNAT family N-acetyltransferase [Paenibacillus paeoniae]REK76691.1 GNAT family N-acetyltransferase [Paenibacillus paeoniae]
MISPLQPEEMDTILNTIDRERHFLYYSYLTSRRSRSIHFGHYSDTGHLLGILAYCSGLSFHAFSVYPIQDPFCVKPLFAHVKERLNLPAEAVGSFIVHEEVKEQLEQQLVLAKPSIPIHLMKHRHSLPLPPADEQVVQLEPASYIEIENKLTEWNTMAFAKEELQNPFYGIWEERQLIALGGYHVYSKEYVELGNIGTDVNWRNRGNGRKISAQLTRSGYAISDHVYLNVLANNAGAIHLYQSLGYDTVSHQFIVTFKL